MALNHPGTARTVDREVQRGRGVLLGQPRALVRRQPELFRRAGGGRAGAVQPAEHLKGKYLIICALSYNPHTNLHINKSREA